MMSATIQTHNKRICSECGTNKSIQIRKLKDGTLVEYGHWQNNGHGDWLCKRCKSRLIDCPKWRSIHGRTYNQKKHDVMKIVFRGKQIHLNHTPRIGVCNFCRTVVGEVNVQADKLCKRTVMHHESYHDDDPLKDTIELCVPCHIAYHIQLEVARHG